MDPFIGQIALFPYNKVIDGWLPCNGQILQIQQNTALYSLIGKTYGGDGKTTFALPDLRGRTIMNAGITTTGVHQVGEQGGSEGVSLSNTTMPAHTHTLQATNTAPNKNTPANTLLAKTVTAAGTPPLNIYAADSGTLVAMAAASIDSAGSGMAHENRQPSLVLQFYIATSGIYPPRP